MPLASAREIHRDTTRSEALSQAVQETMSNWTYFCHGEQATKQFGTWLDYRERFSDNVPSPDQKLR
jgi:hypothetical protein